MCVTLKIFHIFCFKIYSDSFSFQNKVYTHIPHEDSFQGKVEQRLSTMFGLPPWGQEGQVSLSSGSTASQRSQQMKWTRTYSWMVLSLSQRARAQTAPTISKDCFWHLCPQFLTSQRQYSAEKSQGQSNLGLILLLTTVLLTVARWTQLCEVLQLIHQ